MAPAHRAAWLRRACDDTATRDEVAAMCAAHDGSGGLLDREVPTPPRAAPLHPAELARRVEDALVDRYIVEHEMGRGGAATVFAAHERKHRRCVVLKVLNPEVAALWGRERFDREVQIAARLAHPHILGLIDSGEADGLLYYVMPYVEGETLRARLDRRGALPVGEAMALLRDMADALAYAHRCGVVHRDLKPGNVLCVGEHAFLLDFGVAKFVTPVTGQGDITRQGLVVGTPAYMAPEQFAAATEVDGRTDLYAWGLLAFEMLTGALPAPDPRHRTPADALSRVPGVGHEMAELVAWCLAPDPRMRPSSADVVLERMTRLTTHTPPPRPVTMRALQGAGGARRYGVPVGALVGVSLVALLATSPWERTARGAGESLSAPVAVSALDNETGDPTLDVWGRMAGDWITQGIQETGVVPVVAWPTALEASERMRAERAEGRTTNPVDFMRDELGAGTVVSGAYYLVGDSVHFRVEVTDARTGRVLGSLPPLGAPRDSLHDAVHELRGRLMSTVSIWSDDRMARAADFVRHPPTFEAYRAFDRGLQHYVASRYRDAVPEFRAAYARDPSFNTAVVHAAVAYWNVGDLASADSMVRLALSHAGELGAYDRASAEAVEALLVGDGARAREAYRRAAEAAPASKGWYNFAYAALATDRPQDALAALERLDPDRGAIRSWAPYWTLLTHTLHLLGEHERELAAARELRIRFPDRRVGLVLEARALAALGRAAELDSAIASAGSLAPGVYWSQGGAMVTAGQELVAHGHATEGRERLERGARWLEEQRRLDPDVVGHAEWLCDAYYALGRWREAAALAGALAATEPAEMDYRGRVAMTAARLGSSDAERWLEPASAHERGEHLTYRARIAAIRGDPARASSLLAEASRVGLDGAAWIHAYAHQELALLARAGVALPATLRPPTVTGDDVDDGSNHGANEGSDDGPNDGASLSPGRLARVPKSLRSP